MFNRRSRACLKSGEGREEMGSILHLSPLSLRALRESRAQRGEGNNTSGHSSTPALPRGPSGVARVASGEGKLAGTALDTRTYDNGGRLSTSAYSNGITTTWSYRNDNLVTSINATSPAGTPNDSKVANLAYTWDANKNKLSEGHSGVNATVNGFGFNAADTTYDFEDRLTQWKRANGTENQSWNLTAVGDWQSFTRNGTATARTHGPTHELLAIGSASLSYDAKGNLTQDTSRSPTQNYIWNFDNKMKSADIDGNGSPDVTFEFDALGRRVARTQGSDAVIYYQVVQQTIADYPRGGAATSPTYRYFWASYIDELIARKATGSGGELLFGHRNQQYSILSLSDSSGAVVERISYTAYGQPTFTNAAGTTLSSSAKATRYTYTGREWDASLQLLHFRARWMSGVSGRFEGRWTGQGAQLREFQPYSTEFGRVSFTGRHQWTTSIAAALVFSTSKSSELYGGAISDPWLVTSKYCDAAKKYKQNGWLQCACDVSADIDNAIILFDSLISLVGAYESAAQGKSQWFKCTRTCLQERWINAKLHFEKGGPIYKDSEWNKFCSKCDMNASSIECCEMQVTAEQSELQKCFGACGSWTWAVNSQ